MSFRFKKLNEEKGTTMVEMILSITVLAIITTVSSLLIAPWVRSYSATITKEPSQDDARFAFDRITRELQALPKGNITAVSSSQLTFTDATGTNTNFRHSGGVLYRGADKLLDDVTSFTFVYYDSTMTTTSTPANVRVVDVAATMDPASPNVPPFTLKTNIFLRNYAYDNYQ